MDATDGDRIGQIHDAGCLDVLDNIFLRLSPKTARSCKEVNATWNRIIDDHYDSSNRRIKAHQRLKLSNRWKEKRFVVRQIDLTERVDFVTNNACDMMRHDGKVFVGVNTAVPLNGAKVLVFDEASMEYEASVDVQSHRDDVDSSWIVQAADGDFLVAVVGDALDPKDVLHANVWSRKSARPLPLRLTFGPPIPGDCRHCHHPLVEKRLRLRPTMSAGAMSIPIDKVSSGGEVSVVYDVWKLSVEGRCGRAGTENVVAKDVAAHGGRAECCRVSTGSNGILNLFAGCNHGGDDQVGNLQCYSGDGRVLWRKSESGCPFVCHVDEEAICVAWMKPSGNALSARRCVASSVDVLDAVSGEVTHSISDVKEELSSVNTAKLSGDRLAVSGMSNAGRHEIVVWDLESESVVLRCSECLPSPDQALSGAFLLTESRLIAHVTRGPVLVVDYW